MNAKQPISQFAILFVRYIAAIAVTFVTADLVGFLLLWVLGFVVSGFSSSDRIQDRTPDVLYFIMFVLMLFITGLCSIFAGTFCLPRSNRRIGSMILLTLGLAFCLFMIFLLNFLRGGNEDLGQLPWILPLAAGGAASAWYFRRRALKTAQGSASSQSGQ